MEEQQSSKTGILIPLRPVLTPYCAVEEEFVPRVIEVTDEEKKAIARLPYLETTNASSVIINPKTYKPYVFAHLEIHIWATDWSYSFLFSPVQEEEEPPKTDANVPTPSQVINSTFEPYIRKMTKVRTKIVTLEIDIWEIRECFALQHWKCRKEPGGQGLYNSLVFLTGLGQEDLDMCYEKVPSVGDSDFLSLCRYSSTTNSVWTTIRPTTSC